VAAAAKAAKCLIYKMFTRLPPRSGALQHNGLTNLRKFHPVRHTLSGPDTPALPDAPRHTVFQTRKPTIACLSQTWMHLL